MSSRMNAMGSLPVEENLVDDAQGVIPMIGLKTPQSLRERFLARLERLMDAEITLVGDATHRKMLITVALAAGPGQRELDDDVYAFLGRLQTCLRRIASIEPGVPQKALCDSLWEDILIYSYSRSKQAIDEIRQAYDDHRGQMDNFITTMFRINDIEAGGSDVDDELGTQLIHLYHGIQGYDGSMKQTHELVQLAATMARIFLHLQERIRGLLRKAKFANSLYRLICRLGFPERVHNTLVRAANSCVEFQGVSIEVRRIGGPKQGRSVSSMGRTTGPKSVAVAPSAPPKASSKATSLVGHVGFPPARPSGNNMPQIVDREHRALYPNHTSTGHVDTPGPVQENAEHMLRYKPTVATSSVPLGNMDSFEALQPFLASEGRALDSLILQPRSKQMAVQLVVAVLSGKFLPVESEAWHQLGFVVTQDKAEEQQLVEIYAELLKKSPDPDAMFKELVEAIEMSSLVDLFDRNDCPQFRHASRHLEKFLATQPQERPTVWRLKQFVHSDPATEPPGCLQRDYGFRLCRNRDEVDRMKSVYATMLRTTDPLVIHGFCLVDRLHEEGVVKTGIPMNPRDARLMKNDYPSPFLGFDDHRGLERYGGPFFKRCLKP